jgi:hypothetical protein
MINNTDTELRSIQMAHTMKEHSYKVKERVKVDTSLLKHQSIQESLNRTTIVDKEH